MDIDLTEQLIQFQRSVEYSGADGLEIPSGQILVIYQLVLNYGKYTAYSDRVLHELVDCQPHEVSRASAILSPSEGSPISSRQQGIWIAIGVVGIILLLLLLILLWRFRDKLCCEPRSVYDLSMDPLQVSSQLALDASRSSLYLPDYEDPKSSSSLDQPPSYNTFVTEMYEKK